MTAKRANAKPRKVSAADQALLERAVAVGGTAYRDDEGRIVLFAPKNTVRLSLADRKRLREMIDESNADLLAHGGKIVETPNPANLLGGVRHYFLKKQTDAQIADVIKVGRFSGAERRIEKLRRHPELCELAEQLAQALPVDEGRLSKAWRAVIPNDPFWAELAHAEMLALAYDAAPRVTRGRKHQQDTKRGGKKRHANSPQHAAMQKVRAEYDRWQSHEVRYANDADFAKKMHAVHAGAITNEGSIKNAVSRWRKAVKSSC